MKFRTAYNCSERFCSPSGSRFRKLFQRKIHSNGSKELVENGTEDTYQIIQLAAKGNLLPDLIRRSQLGDPSAIGNDIGSYPDLTRAPKNLLDAENLLLKARSIYDSLPSDTKNKYGNSYVQFLSAVDDGSFIKDSFESTASKVKKKEPTPAFTDEQIKFIKEKINA